MVACPYRPPVPFYYTNDNIGTKGGRYVGTLIAINKRKFNEMEQGKKIIQLYKSIL